MESKPNEIEESSVIANQKDLQQVPSNDENSHVNRSATILVVDDTLYNIQLLYLMLSKQGYNVVKASSGREALDIAEDILPDLILLDIRMPVLDGYEVCSLLKQNDRTNHIPVIFISSIDNPTEKVEAFSVGGGWKPICIYLVYRNSYSSRINNYKLQRNSYSSL